MPPKGQIQNSENTKISVVSKKDFSPSKITECNAHLTQKTMASYQSLKNLIAKLYFRKIHVCSLVKEVLMFGVSVRKCCILCKNFVDFYSIRVFLTLQ
jgi:hypothetical protein